MRKSRHSSCQCFHPLGLWRHHWVPGDRGTQCFVPYCIGFFPIHNGSEWCGMWVTWEYLHWVCARLPHYGPCSILQNLLARFQKMSLGNEFLLWLKPWLPGGVTDLSNFDDLHVIWTFLQYIEPTFESGRGWQVLLFFLSFFLSFFLIFFLCVQFPNWISPFETFVSVSWFKHARDVEIPHRPDVLRRWGIFRVKNITCREDVLVGEGLGWARACRVSHILFEYIAK